MPGDGSSIFSLQSSVLSTTPPTPSRGSGGEAFKLPDWVPKDAWDGFIEMRKSIHKPLKTERAVRLAVAKLETLKAAGHDPEEVLNQSTMNGWQGLFEIRKVRGSERDNGSGLVAVEGKPKTREESWRGWRKWADAQSLPALKKNLSVDSPVPEWAKERLEEYLAEREKESAGRRIPARPAKTSGD
jgi:hypothetical protein